MKASRFVKAFEQDVDHWERTLSHILEVVEMLLTVQRQWMYLEVSFTDLFKCEGDGLVRWLVDQVANLFVSCYLVIY